MSSSTTSVDEAGLIDWMRRNAPRGNGVRIGIGDDAALVRADGDLLVTTDMLLDGVHFVWGKDRPEDVGWKAMACNLSDVAAMGGRPAYAVAAVAFPRGTSARSARALHRGMLRAAARFGVRVVGGDTNASLCGVVVCVTLLGHPPPRPVTRAGARVGDAVYVTGALGGSILGRHLRFVPRVEEGCEIARRWRVRAMMDVTDGLLLDASRLAHASGVGVAIDGRRVPISAAARRLARRTKKTALEHALHDGEDFELLFAIAPENAARLERGKSFSTRLTRVGEIVPRGLFLIDERGRANSARPGGFDHFADPATSRRRAGGRRDR
jgi:thiamine-monophosphate kinase